MKLSEHVDKLRDLIEAAFDKQFARLGIGKIKLLDIEKLPEEVRPKRLRYVEILNNHIGETGNYEHAREKLIDELTFTLFNRLAAVKVMEAAALFPPVLTRQPDHGDRSFGHKAWLELNPDMRSKELEGIREYIKVAFNELGETLPLYSKAYPYALLPDAISLNEIIDTFNAVEKDTQVGADIWQSDDVLGWMYESYNNRKKKAHKDSGDKTEYNKVSLQSQVYTPRWVVQFLVENSLGKLYLEMYPDSGIKSRYKIANAPKAQERNPKPLHEIKVIDPACGSGNFLLYAFDFFYELYVDQIDNYGADYNEKNIPKLIIENNLHGIDLDDRAVQLAQLGLYIKAKKKRRTIGSVAFKVVSSDFYLPNYETVEHIFTEGNRLDASQQKLIEEIWTDLHYAYKFGSLIRLDEKLKARLHVLAENRIREKGRLFSDQDLGMVPQPVQGDLFLEKNIEEERLFASTFFTNLKRAVAHFAQAHGNTFLTSKTRDAITFLELLTTEYDVATTNPPYTDSADFGPELKEFIEDNYKKPFKFHTNLYATFIKRCFDLTNNDGRVAMIHPYTFMFIKSFEDVRKYILKNSSTEVLVDWGLDRVNLFDGGYASAATFYVLSKRNQRIESAFLNMSTGLQEKQKLEKFRMSWLNYLNSIIDNRIHVIDQNKFKEIKSFPFIYWISNEYRKIFSDNPLTKEANVFSGIKTGNNNGALRFWWEINGESIFSLGDKELKWIKYNKGGNAKKWYGNNWLCVDFRNNCAYIKKQRSYSFLPEEYAFQTKINYSGIGSRSVSFRILDNDVQNDMGASGLVPKTDILFALAVLNSKISSYNLNCLNPTVNKQPNDVKRMPLKIGDLATIDYLKPLVNRCIEINIYLEKYSIIEYRYQKSPLELSKEIRSSLLIYFNLENHLTTQVLINEAIINDKVFEVYDLTEHDKAMVLAKEGESIGALPVLVEAREAFLIENGKLKIENGEDSFPLSGDVIAFINNLTSKVFAADEIEKITSGFPTLYQSNNDLEEFCIRHQVNPINVWYWFKQSNVIPQQRMHTLAMEFLVDMVREILMEDEDGMIPLVPNAGEKVLLDRIEEKFREKGFSSAQFSSFDTVLGRPIHEYLNRFFFAELSDHLNLFMYLPKTPFIWHLSSGSEQGFDCYIIIYKWSRDKMMRLRSVYIEHRERSLVNRQSDLSGSESADAQNEKERIFRQLKEIEAFKKKIDELLAEGYNPILDDGVGKNIAPLQKKGLIPYEVLNAGQLKKYLNADW